MKISLCVVGRLRAGPEKQLIDDYLTRFDRTGRALSLGPTRVIEVEDRKGGGMAAEAALLRKAIPKEAALVVLDERGRTMSSPDFANRIADFRDSGRSEIAFVIGGADGIDPALRSDADLT
ncbi:MAG: 23S rRNA (pseudouridine(1915)-N(3))-methyltransferase RlmH, partial [Dinoroseobacter sp.]|nr:23S rRNA (pseudouridine(1915)-N(3))-methyltransferase RlmH [Dinoroseobacter sp.]